MLGINPEDVKKVLNSITPQLVIIGVMLALAIILTIVAIKIKKPLKGLVRKQAWLAFALTLVIVLSCTALFAKERLFVL